MNNPKKLRDIGERHIIDDIIMERFDGLKSQDDDCAIVKLGTQNILLSTDPAPRPIAFNLGFVDYYYYGWLTAVVNLSDLASMGAEPLGILTACVMREDMFCSDYNRFLEGLADACKKWNCPLLGGNIKDGKDFSANGFIIGKVMDEKQIMKQSTACEDNIICVIGEMGHFWSAVVYFKYLQDELIVDPREHQALFEALVLPSAKVLEGIKLASTGAVTACTDNSDGITWSLINMARKSGVDFVIDIDSLPQDPLVQKIATAQNIDYPNLLFAGGDYQLVCTIKRDHIKEVQGILNEMGTPFYVLGYTKKGSGHAIIKQKDQFFHINDLSSERFASDSIFTQGYEAYIDSLTKQKLKGFPYV